MNSIFGFGLALGFIANLIASQRWELVARYRAWKAARKLVGTWVAYNMRGCGVHYTDARRRPHSRVCEELLVGGGFSGP